ncbi:MAG: SDR family NAD(P)-dependent oxidoreductase [Lapillicoccus sp.]
MRPTAVITGGGSGIGAATAARLVADGFDVVLCGRRLAPLEAVVADLGAAARLVVLDVTAREAVFAAAAEIGACDILVNNAGGALGTDRVESGDPDDWRSMYDSNVLGTLHVTQAFLPALRRSPAATIVNVTSIAALLTYEGGAGYTAAKHAQSALTETLRLELNGTQIRVVEIAPGMVHTEGFALVRNHGDQSRADAVYSGVDRPLVADDVAACIAFCVGLPQHVTIDRLVVKPVAQAAPHKVFREPIPWGGASD